jgi:hypothetical protein
MEATREVNMTRRDLLDAELLTPDGKPMLDVALDLDGPGGNVFAVIATCCAALKRAGFAETILREFRQEMCSSEDYTRAMVTVTRYFEVEWLSGRPTWAR